jgi:hypothetical protein
MPTQYIPGTQQLVNGVGTLNPCAIWLGDVMIHAQTLQLVLVVVASDTQVECVDYADYTGPLCVFELDCFLESFRWIRNSAILYACWQSPGVPW